MNFYISTLSDCYEHRRFFFGKTRVVTDLLSIAIVAENGEYYTAFSSSFKRARAFRHAPKGVYATISNDLPGDDLTVWKSDSVIAKEILEFVVRNTALVGDTTAVIQSYESIIDLALFKGLLQDNTEWMIWEDGDRLDLYTDRVPKLMYDMPDEAFGIDSPYDLIYPLQEGQGYSLDQKYDMIQSHPEFPARPRPNTNALLEALWTWNVSKFVNKQREEWIRN